MNALLMFVKGLWDGVLSIRKSKAKKDTAAGDKIVVQTDANVAVVEKELG